MATRLGLWQPKRATILIADNDPTFLRDLRQVLEDEGYRVITETNTIEIRRRVEEGNVDLVLTDIRLRDDDDDKDRSGLKLAREIAPSVPVILVTRYLPYNEGPEAGGLPENVSFIAKQAKLETILFSVKRTLASVQAASEEEPSSNSPTATTPRNALAKENGRGASKWLKRRSPFIALILLLIALLMGVLATVLENPMLLIGTVVSAILAVVFIGLSIE
jgi:DNA-binding NtrC family response regulator